MEQFAREDVLAVFRRFGVVAVRRAADVDEDEEIFLLVENDIASPELTTLTLELMEVLPHKKVWVTADGPRWKSEPL
jgi:hypothetical protein